MRNPFPQRRITTALFLFFIALFLASAWRSQAYWGSQASPMARAEVRTDTANVPAEMDPFPTPDDPLNNLFCNVPGGASTILPCHLNVLLDHQPAQDLDGISNAPCLSGLAAGVYPCHDVDLLSFIPLDELAGTGVEGNDIWGWTDSLTGKEYAIMGLTNGTVFVDISDPIHPVRLGNLPTHTGTSIWRSIKVYANHAFVVADYAGAHGMQIFDLTQLRDVANPPVTFAETDHYDLFGSAHNVAINEASGYAYAVGVSSGLNTCAGGLHMIKITEPTNPKFDGCFSADGYTHDTQCVIYDGPDTAHQGQEICFNANVDTLTIVDVTDKSTPVLLSRRSYVGNNYAHQGWLTADQRYFLLDDEGDETSYGHNSRTHIWDLIDLGNPQHIGAYTAAVAAIDHNLYIHDGYAYEANYRSGLRVLNLAGVAGASLSEVAYFDVYPADDNPNFNGAWSNYPFFASGVVIVSGIEQGLFVLRPTFNRNFAASLGPASNLDALPTTTITHTFTLANLGLMDDTYELTLSGAAWPTTLLSSSSIAVASNMTATLSVAVTTPAVGGVSDTFTLTATSVAAPTVVEVAAVGTTNAVSGPEGNLFFLPAVQKP